MATKIEAGVVDVFVIEPRQAGWRVLLLQRAPGVRCAGGWEAVHGSIEPGELPEDAARREVREETGLVPERLYSVTVNSFYVVPTHTVQLAVVFVAFVGDASAVAIDTEHQAYEWLSIDEAKRRFLWPSERRGLDTIIEMFPAGYAGFAEDVLRVPDPTSR